VAAVIAIVALAAAAPAGAMKTVFAKKLTRILPHGKEPVLFEGGAFLGAPEMSATNLAINGGSAK
jgi:hypothetical protein